MVKDIYFVVSLRGHGRVEGSPRYGTMRQAEVAAQALRIESGNPNYVAREYWGMDSDWSGWVAPDVVMETRRAARHVFWREVFRDLRRLFH